MLFILSMILKQFKIALNKLGVTQKSQTKILIESKMNKNNCNNEMKLGQYQFSVTDNYC